ncbi:MAG: c-type cytochrome [Granulosicoccaceae bacterium]|jgi:cytochrome c5
MLKRTTFLSLIMLTLLAGCGKEEPKEAAAPEAAAPETAPMEAPAPEAAMPEVAPAEAPAPEAAMPETAPMEAPAAPEAAAPEPAPAEPAPAPEAAAPAVQSTAMGKKVYDSICVACHAAGVAGAPKVGDKAAWAARIEQGVDTLYAHSINGFQGKSGVMPPKGGNMSLSDDEVKAAVDHMVAQSQ